jgi:hypothetical protein
VRLKRIFLERAGGRADDDALDEIKELCLGAMRAVDDGVCGGRLLTIHCCAAALYSDKAHRSWDRRSDRGFTSGVDVLRRRIFRALNGYQRRLYQLGLMRHGHDSCSVVVAGAYGDERPQEKPYRAEGDSPAPGGRPGVPPGV